MLNLIKENLWISLLVCTLLFIFWGLLGQIIKMWAAWSVEGFAVEPMIFNVIIQIQVFFFGRQMTEKKKSMAVWIPAIPNLAFSLSIVILYHMIS